MSRRFGARVPFGKRRREQEERPRREWEGPGAPRRRALRAILVLAHGAPARVPRAHCPAPRPITDLVPIVPLHAAGEDERRALIVARLAQRLASEHRRQPVRARDRVRVGAADEVCKRVAGDGVTEPRVEEVYDDDGRARVLSEAVEEIHVRFGGRGGALDPRLLRAVAKADSEPCDDSRRDGVRPRAQRPAVRDRVGTDDADDREAGREPYVLAGYAVHIAMERARQRSRGPRSNLVASLRAPLDAWTLAILRKRPRSFDSSRHAGSNAGLTYTRCPFTEERLVRSTVTVARALLNHRPQRLRPRFAPRHPPLHLHPRL